MTELSPTTDTTLARVGDADRAAACDQLSTHYAAGRISAEELDQRLEAAWTARTRRDLYVVLRDLTPPPSARRPTGSVPLPARPASTVPVWLVALVSVSCLTGIGSVLLVLGLHDPVLALVAAIVGLAGGVAGACVMWLIRRWPASVPS